MRTMLTIRTPDDYHLHLRDDHILQAVGPFTARVFGRAIAMPNLVPPVTTVELALAYKERIQAVCGNDFTPLMTAYLTDTTDAAALRQGYEQGVFTAAKLYPAGATTNADNGVTSLAAIGPVLDMLQETGMPLLVHAEVTDTDVHIMDREEVYIDRVLVPLQRDFPHLRLGFEHLTTKTGVDYVLSCPETTAATITPHHLLLTTNHIFNRGMNPHLYCLPIAKRATDRDALRKAACSGTPKFFLGTDSAPHLTSAKHSGAAPAGIFSTPMALQCVAQVFEEMDALDQLESFVSLNGPRYYGLEPHQETITLERRDEPLRIDPVPVVDDSIAVFTPPHPIYWHIAG